MLVLPNRDVWTFEALDDKVDLEDSVFLAGNDGPRRTAQIVIRQDSRQPPRSAGVLCARTPRPPPPAPAATPAASRNCRCSLSLAHGLFGKPASTLPDHATRQAPSGFARWAVRDFPHVAQRRFRRRQNHATRRLNSEDPLMTDTLRRVTRALLSVSDKTGLIEFARALAAPRRRAGLDRRHRQGDRRGRPEGARRLGADRVSRR